MQCYSREEKEWDGKGGLEEENHKTTIVSASRGGGMREGEAFRRKGRDHFEVGVWIIAPSELNLPTR